MTFDWIHLHLMLNHFPVVLGLVGVLAAVIALVGKSEAAWTYAAVTLVLAGLSAPTAFLTGRQAEDEAEKLWFVTQDAIHDHEEAGELATWVSVSAAVLAIVALRRRSPRWRVVMAVVAVAAAGAMGAASFEGGKIVHQNPKLEQAAASGITP